MGSFIEVNDTLQITPEQGFPIDILDLKKHQEKPITLDDVKGKVFSFRSKPRPRLYHLEPVRVFLVQNIKGKWLFWGKIQIQSQEITKKLDENGNWIKDEWVTSGTTPSLKFMNQSIREPLPSENPSLAKVISKKLKL